MKSGFDTPLVDRTRQMECSRKGAMGTFDSQMAGFPGLGIGSAHTLDCQGARVETDRDVAPSNPWQLNGDTKSTIALAQVGEGNPPPRPLVPEIAFLENALEQVVQAFLERQ